MSDLIAALAARAGDYAGEGINHEQQPFRGALTLTPVAEGAGVAVDYRATGTDGTLYHVEHTVIAPGPDGAPLLVTINAHGAGLHTMPLRRDGPAEGGERTAAFGLNDPADTSTFRFEIAVDLWADGALGYRHSWGLPGGDFAPRSGLKLLRV